MQALETFYIAMHIPHYVRRILSLFYENGFEAYIIGGCVRDSLLGLEPKDWDITTNATPAQMQELFSFHTEHFSTIELGVRYGTLGILCKETKKIVEATTYRTESAYKDARHPDSVVFAKSLQEDVGRRDFTINALACKPCDDKENGEEIPYLHTNVSQSYCTHAKQEERDSITMQLFDYYGGIAHLQERRIVCVGNARARFREDGLRIMRAMRFCATLPFGFTCSDETKEAIFASKSRLSCIAKERVLSELMRLLCGEYVASVLPIYEDILFSLMPLLHNLEKKQRYFNYAALSYLPKQSLLRFVVLYCPLPYTHLGDNVAHYVGQYKELCVLLRFSKDAMQESAQLIGLLGAIGLEQCSDKAAIKILLSKYGTHRIFSFLVLHSALFMAYNECDFLHSTESFSVKPHAKNALITLSQNLIAIIKNKECYTISQLAINGTILQEIAQKEGKTLHGKAIGNLLQQLLCDVLYEKIPNTSISLQAQAHIYIQQ